ncbi:hypothetical protein ACFL27_13875 [candidate division CSSED10-310 bacterium]|uniref:Chromosomal replication initiator DnaA C-terminal domain-containing protein n=1 Tax=candidate division CSSED10-310 bacterium TaxID=2855610 RepID=A0ABV6YYL4_UNCC1
MVESFQLHVALGSNRFFEWLQETFFDKKHSQIPKSCSLFPPQAKLLTAVQDFYGCSENDLSQSRRVVSNEPGSVAIYLLRELRDEHSLEIGKLFGLFQYSSVSSVIQNVRFKLTKDKPLQKGIATLINTIRKGQTWI